MEKHIVYIAGNPRAYPLEYYDEAAGCFQGVVPELLRRFSQQGRYEVRYYDSGGKDLREDLAENRQVDLVSCFGDERRAPNQAGAGLLVLETGEDAALYACRLCPLDVAPEGLAEELRDYLSGVSQSELTGLLLRTAEQGDLYRQKQVQSVVLGLLLAVLLLAAGLAVTVLRNRRRMKKLREDGQTDPATGIGSRAYLEHCCQVRLNDWNRMLYSMFCFCFEAGELDAGDAVAFPRLLAATLRDCASDGDVLARVSDGTFALLRRTAGEQESVEWLSAALGRIREGSGQEEGGPALSVAVGICPLNVDDRNLDEVISRAIRSAHDARRAGQDYRFFSPRKAQILQEEQRLRSDARHALENRELQLYLQFYADARTGRVVGGEAIPFWEHPAQGLISLESDRGVFVHEGLAARLDEYMLEQACAFLDSLKQGGREDFFLLYRLSEGTLCAGDLPRRWGRLVEGCRSDCRQLLLDVAWSGGQKEQAARNLEAVRELGVRLVLDFGGQVDELFPAREARFSGMKLGRALVGRLDEPAGRTVLEALLRAGHELGFTVFAQDVETQEQSACLRELGCDLLRGRLYASPLPAWEAGKKLAGRREGEE